MPLEWAEIEAWLGKRVKPAVAIAQWTMTNARQRLTATGDLWDRAHWKEARLEPALRKAQRAWVP